MSLRRAVCPKLRDRGMRHGVESPRRIGPRGGKAEAERFQKNLGGGD